MNPFELFGGLSVFATLVFCLVVLVKSRSQWYTKIFTGISLLLAFLFFFFIVMQIGDSL